jgi:hypothetical protein
MITKYVTRFSKLARAVSCAAALAACSSGDNDFPSTDGTGKTVAVPSDANRDRGGIFDGNFNIFDGGSGGDNRGDGIGVNSYLWRASLDTLSFMPMISADPFGGVIISDWYEDASAAGERFKVTVYILDQRLRADGLKVAVFRQANKSGRWSDAPVKADTAIDLENAILTRARQLRIDSLEQ